MSKITVTFASKVESSTVKLTIVKTPKTYFLINIVSRPIRVITTLELFTKMAVYEWRLFCEFVFELRNVVILFMTVVYTSTFLVIEH